MMRFKTQFDDVVVGYAKWVLAHRWTSIGISLAVAAICMAGLHKAALNNDYTVFFGEDDPKRMAYEHAKQEYTNDDTVFFVVTAKDGEVFDREVLAAVAELTEKSWLLPYATRVDSLTNFQYAWAEEDDLMVRALIDSPDEMTEERLAQAREIALNEPMLQNRLIKRDSPVTGVNVTLSVPEDVRLVSSTITEAAEALLADVEARHPAVSLRLTGLVPLNNAFLVAMLSDLSTLFPAMFALLIIIMALLLKSVLLMTSVLAVVILSALSAMGMLSWMNYEIAGPLTVLPLIVLTLAVADCVHILVSMQTCMRNGLDKSAAIVESLRINMIPVFITSLTTAIGFLCMNTSPVPPLRILGNFTSVGVLVAWMLAIFFLPALVSLLPFRAPGKSREAAMRSAMGRLAEFVLANKGMLFVSLTAITIVFAVAIPSIRVNNQFVEFFEKGYPIRQDTEYAMDHLTGIYQFIFNVPAQESGGVNEPEYLANLDKFTAWLGQQDGVTHVSSIVSTMKRLNRAMHGDDPAMYSIPDSRELAAQYLLLYEMSLPQGVDLNTEVNMDKSATRVVVTTSNLRSEDMAILISDAESWQQQNLPKYMQTPALGAAVMFTDVARTMMESMWVSAPLALLLVVLALMAALRSIKYGLISLLPNLMPLAIGFGFWAFMGKDMNFGMTTIVAMTIGIVVDDTVHFLAKYLRARRELRLSPEDGIRYAFSSVGKAMWVTSFILVAGFSIMMMSPMTYCDNMGLLTSIIIIAALAGDFLLLPSILLYTDGQRETSYATLSEVGHEEKVVGVEA